MGEAVTPRDRLVAIAALLGGGVALGTAPIFVRLAQDSGIGPSATAFWRLVFALAPLGLWTLVDSRGAAARAPQNPDESSGENPDAGLGARRAAIGFAALAGLLFAGDLVTWHAGIVRTSAANATLFANLTPALVVLGAWTLFKEPPGRPVLAALVATLAGAVLLSGAGLSALEGAVGRRAFGDALSVLTAFWYAAYMLAVKAARASWSTARVLAASTLVSAPCVLAAALVLREPLLPTDDIGWVWLVALGLFTHIGGQGGLAYGLGRVSAAVSAIVILIQPVVAAALAWILFAEALGPLQLAGGALVIAGVAVAQRQTRAKAT